MERCVVSASSSPLVPVPIRLSAVWPAWAKKREIHAPDFADRVVHHIVVERLEKLYEPLFIHDSYANRAGRGSHSAVDRLQAFMRQRENMPDTTVAGGWYLQLDIHNFFNSIHRPTLYAMLCQRLEQTQRRGQLPAAHALALRSLCHKLLAQRVAERVRNPAAAAGVPPHKRLCNAAPLRPCHQGVDFLGYVVFTHHRRVRLRVVQHCRAKLQRWHQQHRCFERVRPAGQLLGAFFSRQQRASAPADIQSNALADTVF